MKKLVILIIFSLFCLTGCDEAITTETEMQVESFKEQYFVEMLAGTGAIATTLQKYV